MILDLASEIGGHLFSMQNELAVMQPRCTVASTVILVSPNAVEGLYHKILGSNSLLEADCPAVQNFRLAEVLHVQQRLHIQILQASVNVS